MKNDKIFNLTCLVLIIATFAVGCVSNEIVEKENIEDRFVSVFSQQRVLPDGGDFHIVKDKETDVHYIVYIGNYKVGITPLLDEKGEVYKEESR